MKSFNISARIGAAFVAAAFVAASAAEVNLYTDRQEIFLRELIALYEKQSGDTVKNLYVKNRGGLLERAKAEARSSPADVYVVKGIGAIARFLDAGIVAPNPDATLAAAVADKSLRAPGGEWYAVSRRVRAIFAAPGTTISNYEELANPPDGAKICIRSGGNGYNIDFFADIGARKNNRAALKKWLAGIKQNLARNPAGNDTRQINGVADGECEIGIANSYYYFRALRAADDERRALLEKIKMIIPDNAHINITAMMLAKNAKNPAAAKKFMRFLLSPAAQKIIANANNEFPAAHNAKWGALLRPYKSRIEQNATHPQATAKWGKTVSELLDEIGFDR